MGRKGRDNPSLFRALENVALLVPLAAATACGAAPKPAPVGLVPQIEFNTETYQNNPLVDFPGLYLTYTALLKDQNPAYGLRTDVELNDDNLVSLELRDNGEVAYSRKFDGTAFIGDVSLKLAAGMDHKLEVLAKDADGNDSYAAVTIGADGKVSGAVEPQRSPEARVIMGLGGPYAFEDSFETAALKGKIDADLVPQVDVVNLDEDYIHKGSFVINSYVIGGDEPLSLVLYGIDTMTGKTYLIGNTPRDTAVELDSKGRPVAAEEFTPGSGQELPYVRRAILMVYNSAIPCGGPLQGLHLRSDIVGGEDTVLHSDELRIVYTGCEGYSTFSNIDQLFSIFSNPPSPSPSDRRISRK